MNNSFVCKIKELLKYVSYLLRYLADGMKEQTDIFSLKEKYHCKIHKDALLQIEYKENAVLSKGVYIGAFTVICVFNQTKYKNNSFIEIGEGTYVGEQNNIRACGGSIVIGKKCLISQQVSIIASNHRYDKGLFIMDQPWDEFKTNVTIGDDVWIGCGVQILPGVKIGNGAVLAAGSLVNRDVPENAIVAGVPAKVLKYRY